MTYRLLCTCVYVCVCVTTGECIHFDLLSDYTDIKYADFNIRYRGACSQHTHTHT